MATVLLVVHPRRANAAEYARKASAWLAERGQSVVMPEEDAAALGMAELGVRTARLAGPRPAGRAGRVGPANPGSADPGAAGPVGPGAAGPADPGAAGPDADGGGIEPPALVVALGGDGTVLRAVRMVADRGVPVLGVNLGRLGYLAQVEPDELVSALERFLAGEHSIENRMMLSVTIERSNSSAGSILALNEAVLERPRPGSTVHLSVGIGGRPWTTYAGDGLIVATPTGSTAYSLSARGPILSPTMRALVVTPVSAHMAFDRSLVVGDSDAVRVEVGDDRPAALTIDGRDHGVLRRGDAILCRPAARAARFVTFGDRDFFGILKSKFGVADR